jgi:hypothetical protein
MYYRQCCGSASFFDADADPDLACHFDSDSDPDPTFHFDADPHPSFQIKAHNLEKEGLIGSHSIHFGLLSANDADPDPAYHF